MTVLVSDIYDTVQILAVIITAVWGFARISTDSKNLANRIQELRQSITSLRVDLVKINESMNLIRDRVTRLETLAEKSNGR